MYCSDCGSFVCSCSSKGFGFKKSSFEPDLSIYKLDLPKVDPIFPKIDVKPFKLDLIQPEPSFKIEPLLPPPTPVKDIMTGSTLGCHDRFAGTLNPTFGGPPLRVDVCGNIDMPGVGCVGRIDSFGVFRPPLGDLG